MQLLNYIHSSYAWLRFSRLIKRARNSMNPECEKEAFSQATEVLIQLSHKSSNFINLLIIIIYQLPLSDPLSTAFICHFLEVTALPNINTLLKLNKRLIAKCMQNSKNKETIQANTAIIWGLLAENLAGKGSEKMFTKDLKDLLISNVENSHFTDVKKHSLIALEKFALTRDNKAKIIGSNIANIIKRLSAKEYDDKSLKFCLEASLRYFDSTYHRDKQDFDDISCTLNWLEASSNWKLSPNYLEFRNDRIDFLSIKGTTTITYGCWFYEVELMSCGIMQIGWAVQSSVFKSDDGMGVGDDPNSFGYDGCRKLVWTNGEPSPYSDKAWKSGDYLGVMFNVDTGELNYYLNGVNLGLAIYLQPNDLEKMLDKEGGFQPAFSFTAFQHAKINFGLAPFKYPPKDVVGYSMLNNLGLLTNDIKMGPIEYYKRVK